MSEINDLSGEREGKPDPASQEISSAAETVKSSDESMEVHHHPDLHHKERKFREYFIEFIMIFLAVTLGFFAEGLREHISENTRAREYARMLLNDTIKDSVELRELLTTYQDHINDIDTLQQLRLTQGVNMNDFDFWYYSDGAFTAGRISFNDATLQQVKNSGNLRYFHSLKLKEKIGEYDNITRTFALRLEIELNWVPILDGFYNSLFNYDTRMEIDNKWHSGVSKDSLRKKNYHLLTRDVETINRFLNFCDYRKNTWKDRIKKNIIPTLASARELISLLKSEYHFSDDD